MLPLMLITAAAGQDSIHPALRAARGRKVWMVGAPPEDCRRVEEELGLVVDCDTDWETTEDEVVIWCTEIPHEVGPALLDFLGRSHARVRTHQTNPSAAGTGECGMLFEITVRYPNTGSAAPSSPLRLVPVPAPATQDSIHPALRAARGRKVWMVGAPPEDCRRVEEELGLVVDCDTDWETTEDEVVIWCTEIPHEVGPALLDFLGRSHARVRTHQTNPSAAGTGECGMLFEITVRYPNTGSAAPSSSGTSSFSKTDPTTPASGSIDPALAAIRGRKLWMIRAPPEECARVERELGLVVDCDPNWEALASEEIVIWCTEIAHEAAPALLRYLGKEHYEVRTHQTNPAAAGTGECGMSFEITVRY